MEETKNVQKASYDELLTASKNFFKNNKGCEVRTTVNLIQNLKSHSSIIESFANKAYPILHESTIQLIKDFLLYKRSNGSDIEKKIYENLTVAEFIDRLICKRPLVFFTGADSWLTKHGDYGAGGWDEIGTDKEGSKYKVLKLEDFLSYDEVKIAALLQLSSPSVIVNNGNRNNVGISAVPGTFIENGVYVGVVGARFEVQGRMEYQDMVITQNQNIHHNGYGESNEDLSILKVFANFYNLKNFPTFEEAKKNKEMYEQIDYTGNKLLNKEVYTRRIQISAETFLLEAEHRGITEDRDIYCHVVGLGLGVWQVSSTQNEYFLAAWAQALKQLRLSRVKDVNFSWIATNDNITELQQGKQLNGINIHFSKREPFQCLADEDKNKLVVAMFAWDGNSYVGNEYWQGYLSASGDPAAASCSTIPELLNPDINWRNVTGANVKIATRSNGLISLDDFLKKH